MRQTQYDPTSNTRYDVTANDAPPYTYREAHQFRPPNPHSDVLVPALLSLISAIVVALAAIWLCWEVDWLPAEWVIPTALFGTFIGVWCWQLRLHEAHLIGTHEATSHADQRQPAPTPQVEQAQVHVSLSTPRTDANDKVTGHQVRMFDLPCSDDTLVDVAQAMWAGSTLPESDWAGLNRGKPFSESALKKFKATLVANQLAAWINTQNPRLGIKLTEQGKRFMEEVVKQADEEEQ